MLDSKMNFIDFYNIIQNEIFKSKILANNNHRKNKKTKAKKLNSIKKIYQIQFLIIR